MIEERVLQFGTGVLLRALVVAAVDAANRAGRGAGRIVVVQSTPSGSAAAMNAQNGRFTLVERGVVNGTPVDRTRQVDAISRALVADKKWEQVRALARRAELRVIVSNVTEAGFREDGPFAARLAELLHDRFVALPDGPAMFVIPTELIPDNGRRLAEMVAHHAARLTGGAKFRDWLAARVRFCSSLVDRITTAGPTDADPLRTVTEPYSLWAIEGEPDCLRAAFPIDSPPEVVFATDITTYRDRKLRLLNGAHTATVPVALLAGVPTVREAITDQRVGSFMRRILFDEILPAAGLSDPADAANFARSVWERFSNPWLEHRWQAIAQNQVEKWAVRVAPTVARFVAQRGRVPEGLALAAAAGPPRAEAGPRDFETAVTRWRGVLDASGIDAALQTLAGIPA
ncbi:MAG TPA: hypothetical protein VL549_07675 [Gemmatimonadales bacterium]|nr:hypothetical protein [Gemmatimonadales bacterium]